MKWLDVLWDNEKTLTDKLIALLKFPIGVVLLWLATILPFQSVLNTIADSLTKTALLAISSLLFLLLLLVFLYSLQTSKKLKNTKPA